jgi:hypothetical protein
MLISLSHQCFGLQNGLFLSFFQTKFHVHTLVPKYVLYVPLSLPRCYLKLIGYGIIIVKRRK